MGISTMWIASALVALPGLAVAADDEDPGYDPGRGLGRCKSLGTSDEDNFRTVLSFTTAMVAVCWECDDVRPRRLDIRTVVLEPFNGGTLNKVMVDGESIDLAQTFVKLDETKHGYLHGIYTSAPYKNLALLVGCTVHGPVLRGLTVDDPPVPAPASIPQLTPLATTSTMTVIRGNLLRVLMLALLGAVLGLAAVVISVCRARARRSRERRK